MLLARYEPNTQFNRFDRVMRRLFDEINTPLFGERAIEGTAWSPACDIKQTDSAFVIHAEIPGMKMEDIDIEFAGDTLTIKGERKAEETKENEEYVRCERFYGSFSRTFTLGVPVDANGITAKYHDGIMTITIPKSAEHQPRKIKIDAEP
jgi:HSP20 family protein